jgi:hypothetical protein
VAYRGGPGTIALAGAVAGVVSGAPSTCWWLLTGRGPDPVAATREIGRRAAGRPSLLAGGALHLALSCAFAVPVGAVARRGRLAAALAGAALYAVNFHVVAPRAWPAVRRFDGPPQLADHLAYGLAVGEMLRRLAPTSVP